MPRPTPAINRIMARVVETVGPLETRCWQVQLAPNEKGYVSVQTELRGPKAGVHRIAYEYFVGPIPEGLQIDHLCRVRNCVNPDHLQPVTNRENTLRGESPTAIAWRTNLCIRGHSLEDALTNGPRRRCRTCYRDRDALRRSHHKAAA